jgi:hypothetical protein
MRPVDINVSTGYRPPFTLYGQIYELLETDSFPLGAYLRLSVIPFKRRWGYMGFEFEPVWSLFEASQENYTVQAHMPGVAIYGVYRRLLPNRIMAFDFRIGGGIYSVMLYQLTFNRGKTEPMAILFPVFATGVSFTWFVRKPFFLEAGLDYIHFFTVDDPSPGYLRPFLGLGWQF